MGSAARAFEGVSRGQFGPGQGGLGAAGPGLAGAEVGSSPRRDDARDPSCRVTTEAGEIT